jgi:hypothetical protein
MVVTEKDAPKLDALARGGAMALGQVLVVADRLRWDWGEESLRALVVSVPETERTT